MKIHIYKLYKIRKDNTTICYYNRRLYSEVLDLGFEGHYQKKKGGGGIIISIRNNNCKAMGMPWYIHGSWDVARWMLNSVTRVKQREKKVGR